MPSKSLRISAQIFTFCLILAMPGTIHAQSLHGTCGLNAIDTAIGCIPTDSPTSFTNFVLKWAIGLASGIAVLMIIYAGFEILTSSGDPKRLQAGQELLTATISGLLLIVFSVFLLRIIGINILGIFT